MTIEKAKLGQWGENLAADYLQKQGYRIIERNFRNALGEIDIIAREGDTLCFVEVRTKTSLEQGHPLESISERKKRHMIRMAASYLKDKRLFDADVRFDVVAVLPENEGEDRLELIKNAFEVE